MRPTGTFHVNMGFSYGSYSPICGIFFYKPTAVSDIICNIFHKHNCNFPKLCSYNLGVKFGKMQKIFNFVVSAVDFPVCVISAWRIWHADGSSSPSSLVMVTTSSSISVVCVAVTSSRCSTALCWPYSESPAEAPYSCYHQYSSNFGLPDLKETEPSCICSFKYRMWKTLYIQILNSRNRIWEN